MNCLIVDNDQIARASIAEMAGKIKCIHILAQCDDAMQAYNFLQSNSVDIMFLDIEMPGMSGIELTRSLEGACPVIIFISAKREYALEAFELNVADYLLKPVSSSRFIQAVNRAKYIIESKRLAKRSLEEIIFIKDSNIVKQLKVEDILYAEAMGDFVKLYTAGKFYAIHSTMSSVEERLPPGRFLRIHRCYIVALNKIETYQDNTLMIGKKFIPVAVTYRKSLNEKLNVL